MKLTVMVVCTLVVSLAVQVCTGPQKETIRTERFIILDPGHFHASLLLRNSLEGISDTVHIYAPGGAELDAFLAAVEGYNNRAENPTAWVTEIYMGGDYLERMVTDSGDGVVVLAGNNRRKTEYILEAVKSGHNVLSDKPMAIDSEDFEMLVEAFDMAADKGLVIYDMMTERYDILNMVARELVNDTDLFGEVAHGSADVPSISMRSVHHFSKTVSGKPLKRPAWYYDVEQQGEGIADVTTHLIDLVSWSAFPGETVSYPSDVEVVFATHFSTRVSLEEFARSTGEESLPSYMEKYLKKGVLEVMTNGSLVYRIKGIHVGIEVVWNYLSPDDGDTFSALINGTKAVLNIVQDTATSFVKQLYIGPAKGVTPSEFEKQLVASVEKLRITWPFISAQKHGDDSWLIDISLEDRSGHEAHFSLIAGSFLDYLCSGNIPAWEIGNSISKYYITTRAVEIANSR